MHREGSVPSTRSRGQQGTLEQQPNGKWKARYRESGRDGKRPTRVFDTRTEASRWLRDRLDDLDQARAGDRAVLIRQREAGRTVDEAVDDYLAAFEASPGRVRVLTEQLQHARRRFGTRPLQSVEPFELMAWRKTISAGYRSDVFRAFAQVLRQAHAWHWIAHNPAAGIRNPDRRRGEVTPLPWETAVAVAGEIDQAFEAVPVFAVGTGLRPEEWLALERRDVDLEQRLVHVRRVYSEGEVVELGAEGAKTFRQRRTVPLRQAVVDALAATIPRIDTPVLFPAKRRNRGGGWHMSAMSFRQHFWRPAFTAAGLPYQRPYDMRHTYAADSIAAGIDLFTLSRRMGTSLQQIDSTYGHLVRGSEERELALLDSYDAALDRVAEAGR